MFVVLLIVFVGSVLVTWLLPLALKSERPYGLVGDVAVGTIVAVIWAIVIYEVLGPLLNFSGWLLFVGTILESIGMAAVMLWVLRVIKR